MSSRARTTPPRVTWSRMNVTMFTSDGPRTEPGFVSPEVLGLAVTPVPGSARDWSVTHIPSGFAISFREDPNIGRFHTIDGAKIAAIALGKLANWINLSAEDIRANEPLRQRIREILSAVAEAAA